MPNTVVFAIAGVVALILLAAVLVLLLLLGFTRWVGRVGERMTARRNALLDTLLSFEPLIRTGHHARGKIVNIEETGTTLQGDDHYVCNVTVQLTPAGTGADPHVPHRAECIMWILDEDRPRFVPGTEHDVWIDPQNPQRVALEGTHYDVLRYLRGRR